MEVMQKKGGYTANIDSKKNGIFSFITLNREDFEKGLEHLKKRVWKFGEFTFLLSNYECLFEIYKVDSNDLNGIKYEFIDQENKIKIQGNNNNYIELEVLGNITEKSFSEFKKEINIEFIEEIYFKPIKKV